MRGKATGCLYCVIGLYLQKICERNRLALVYDDRVGQMFLLGTDWKNEAVLLHVVFCKST